MKISARKILLYIGISTLCACEAPMDANNPGYENDYYTDSTIWENMRANFALLTPENEAQAQSTLHWYLAHPRTLNQALTQSAPYIYYVFHQTRQYDMPAEIALIPAVESNYNPFSYSKDGAVGMWQFMPGTASGLGVKINWWYDGRRDIKESTQASLAYLNYLHKYEGNWLAAIGSYDSGPGTIDKARKRQRLAHASTNYWDLKLPAETERYVPKVIALSMIINDPQRYGVKLPPVPDSPYFGTITCHKSYSIEQIAKLAQMHSKDVRILNPGFRRSVTPSNVTYNILLPLNRVTVFKQNASLLSASQISASWQHHVVKNGDTLSALAHHYQTSVETIKRMNHLHNDTLHLRQNLIIPKGDTSGVIAPNAANASIAEDHIPGPMRVVYKVKRGDTVNQIASIYDLSTRAILYWNKLSKHSTLSAGQEIVIWLSPHQYAQTRFYDYTVQPGDNLITIAHKYHSSVAKIKIANHLSSDKLRLKQKLAIPGALHWTHKTGHHKHVSHYSSYKVRPGDSLARIAKKFHMHTKTLERLNNMSAQHILHVGDHITVLS